MYSVGVFRLLILLANRHTFVHAAVSNNPINRDLLATYGTLSRPISNVEVIAESPLFCPRDDFYSLENAKRCSERTRGFLFATRSLVDATLNINRHTTDHGLEASGQRYEFALSQLTALLSAKDNQMHVDYVYECCWIAALVMARAIDSKTPFKEMGTLFQETDGCPISDLRHRCKEPMSEVHGVWIALVGASVAIVGTPHHSYMESTLRHVYLELAYKSSIFEAATIASMSFVRLQSSQSRL